MRNFTPFSILQAVLMMSIAVGLRLGVASSSSRVPVGDEVGYDVTGWSLATGQGYNMAGRLTYKAPLYSMFLAGVYQIAGHDYRAVRIAQAFLGASLCGLVGWLGWLLLGQKVGWLSGWLVAIYPVYVGLTERLLSEGLFTWLVTLTLIGLALVLRSPRWWKAVLVGVCCGLAALTRSAGIGFVVVAVGIIMAMRPWMPPPRQRAGYGLLVVLSCILTILPWSIRNWIKLHAVVPISTETGLAFRAGWGPFPEGKRLGFHPEDESTRYALTIESEVARDRLFFLSTLDYLRAHPGEIIRLLWLKTLYFWSPFDWEILGKGEGIYNGLFVSIIPFVLLGLRQLGRFHIAPWVLLPSILMTFGIVLLFAGLPRFRYPIEPCLILLASLGLLNFVSDGRYAGRMALVGSWAFVNLFAMAFSAPVKIAARTVLEWVGVW